jgi:hypothetical protein
MNEWIVEQWTPDGHAWRQVEGPFALKVQAKACRDRRQRRDVTRRFRVPDRKVSSIFNLSSLLKKTYDSRYFQRMLKSQTPLLEFLALKKKKG